MKYFEVVEPYYALLKAENEEHAKEAYNETVADLEDTEEIKEVPEDYALARFSQTTGEDGKLIDPKEIAEEFRDKNLSILIIDGSLI